MAEHTYSNPRMEEVFTDWPSGRHRTTAIFAIERDPKRGERGTRRTLHPETGRASAPKLLTYGDKARIVDGDDGRTYILVLSTSYGHITVFQSNMQFQEDSIFARDPRYAGLLALFEESLHDNA